ncbi:MAG: YHS domain protein [Micavibrio sp. TMED27]|nr:YHS domain protein [Micavibrio sp.]OUT92359.1 MAG: YHS domain protein [Micavibrio sp. TMED27]|tara:strand:+ start:1999 stop:2445 length:447 start_codon:yes stop_codon:yes gene_type:complete
MKKLLLSFFALALMIPTLAQAEVAHSTVGVQGYDLVSYQTDAKPLPGNGNHVVTHDGVNYLFTSKENKKTFEKNPSKYLPAYGGYCAYGTAVGKKFIADPNVYEVVNGKLYLNLDNKIKGIWSKDISGNISKANANWPEIKDKAPSEL